MDLGDWLELSRLRAENHSWHRCVDGIVEAMRSPTATWQTITAAVETSVDTLNAALSRLHRRPVTRQR